MRLPPLLQPFGRKWKIAGFTVLAVLMLGYAAFVGSVATSRNSHSPHIKPVRFETTRWKSPSSSAFEDDTRASMLEDLLARHDFTGWSRPKLESVLGVADDFDAESRSVDAPEKWDLLYHAGTEWIDFRCLVFELDDAGNVKRYQIELY